MKFIEDEDLRIKMGREGRKFVRDNYEINLNFSDIAKIYNNILNK